MNRADLVNRLKWVLADVRGGTRAAVNEAIALIEPQPVTEAGLREAGFEYKPLESLYCTKVGVWLVAVCVKDVVTVWLQPPSGPDEELHITDMQHLHAVIAALRGKP